MLDFESFKRSFKGDLVTPSDPDYADAISRWAANAQRNAQVVAFVRGAADVALAVKYARENKLPLAVKCGGHSAGGASSSKGLVIDLSRHMNSVRIDPEKKLAYVGGGAIWETVDNAAIKHELATVAGTVNHTGVGGLTLGGGYGWLSGAHGLAIDNLVEATIVTADGSILTASETENPDLFFGIRGGGSNFGVCVEFVQRLHYQRPRVFAGIAIYAADVLDRGLVAITDNWWKNGPSEKEGMMQLFTTGLEGKPIVVIFFFYNGTAEEGRANYKAFFYLHPLVDRTGEIPYEKLNTIANSFNGHGRCSFMRGMLHGGPVLDSIRQSFERATQLSGDDFKINIVYEYFPLQKINSVPNGATAFIRRGYGNLGLSISWINDTPENTAKARNDAQELSKLISAGQAGTFMRQSGYGNWDSDADKKAVVADDSAKNLFGENYARLQEVKAKYDPDVVFSKWFVVLPVSRSKPLL